MIPISTVRGPYPCRVVPLPEYLGGVDSVNACLIYVNQLVSKILQLPFPLLDARHNVAMFCLSAYTFLGLLPPVPKLMYQQDFQGLVYFLSTLGGESRAASLMCKIRRYHVSLMREVST